MFLHLILLSQTFAFIFFYLAISYIHTMCYDHIQALLHSYLSPIIITLIIPSFTPVIPSSTFVCFVHILTTLFLLVNPYTLICIAKRLGFRLSSCHFFLIYKSSSSLPLLLSLKWGLLGYFLENGQLISGYNTEENDSSPLTASICSMRYGTSWASPNPW